MPLTFPSLSNLALPSTLSFAFACLCFACLRCLSWVFFLFFSSLKFAWASFALACLGFDLLGLAWLRLLWLGLAWLHGFLAADCFVACVFARLASVWRAGLFVCLFVCLRSTTGCVDSRVDFGVGSGLDLEGNGAMGFGMASRINFGMAYVVVAPWLPRCPLAICLLGSMFYVLDDVSAFAFGCLPACLLVCLPVCLLACMLACWLACYPVCLPVCLLACLLASLWACLLACLPAYLSACLPACLPPCLLAHLAACLLACLPACLPACMYAYMFTCLLGCLPACLLSCRLLACLLAIQRRAEQPTTKPHEVNSPGSDILTFKKKLLENKPMLEPNLAPVLVQKWNTF